MLHSKSRSARSFPWLLGALSLLAGAQVAGRQSPGPAGHEQARFGTRTEAVLVDVSVTDRKGRPITDLKQDDFQVFEDGDPQRILTFARHQPDPNAKPADAARAAGLLSPAKGPAGSAGPTTGRGPSVIALAFDRLSPEGRMLAMQAAKQFVKDKQPDELAGVFIVDQALGIVAPYTTDVTKLDAAIDRVATTATTRLARNERNPELAHFYSSPDVPWVAGAEEQGRAAGDQPWVDPIAQVASGAEGARGADGARLAEAQILRSLQRMERSYNDMMYEMQGQASMNALLALVDSLGALDGRKAIVYFCEGLTIPPSVQPKFRAIIDNANRLNVTVYSIDAAGLRVQSKQAETLRTVQQIGAMGIGDIKRENMSAKYSDALEDNERALTLDPAVSLGILASQTGGLLINNTNDLARGIEKIDTDRRNYYLLSYSSTNPVEDGKFRKIAVMVNRPNVEVRARSGYRAVPTSDAGPVLAYEAPALAALERTPPPKDIQVSAAAYSVPMPGRPDLAAIVVNVPGSSLSFETNSATKRYTGEVVVLAHVAGRAGELPRKLSQQYNLSGDLDHVAETRSKRILFFRTPRLAPGTHAVDIAVHDGPAHRDAVVRTTVTIPPATRPVVGDLILVDHAEPVGAGGTTSGNPLAANDLILIPAFEPTLSKQDRKEINFAVSLLLDPKAPLPEATLMLLAGGQPVSSIPLPLTPPDADGRRLAVGRVPIDAIPVGRYDLQVTIGTGEHAQSRTAALTVAE
jgi:VWFA-related protein